MMHRNMSSTAGKQIENNQSNQQKIISGKEIASQLRLHIKEETAKLALRNIIPGLAVVIVGDDPASHVYVRNKGVQAKEVGFYSIEHKLPEKTTQLELLDLISQLNKDDKIHGILVQLPLPNHIDDKAVINAILPEKDVDGFTLKNVGQLNIGAPALVPCTPLGCLKLLQHHLKDQLSGKHAIVIGRSNIVGKPIAALLLQHNCTVTIAHSKTKNIEALSAQADIIIAAIGQPKLINSQWIKPGAIVIDVGINRISELNEEGETMNKLVGDVDFSDVINLVEAITPVPGGVGPMTIACLLDNTLTAVKIKHNI